MKSLGQRLSEVTTPFDEIEQTQEELANEQYNLYKRDSLIEALSKKSGRESFDLFFDDLMQQYDTMKTNAFLSDCLIELNRVYNLNTLYDYITREGLIENNKELIIDLIKYFVYGTWVDDIFDCLPQLINIVDDRLSMAKMVKERFIEIQNKIIDKPTVNELFIFYFKFCALTDGIKTLTILIFKDPIGIVSKQLEINNKGE